MTFFNIFSKKPIKEEKKTIIVDHREKNSLIPSELIKRGFQIEGDLVTSTFGTITIL